MDQDGLNNDPDDLGEWAKTSEQRLGSQEGNEVVEQLPNEDFEERVFMRTQKIQQRPGESSEALHDRLRPYVRNSFTLIEKPTKVKTPSWYTFDSSSILGKDTFVLSTSTCKHETPLLLFVGTRKKSYCQQLNDGNFEYTIYPLGRDITEEEKDQIYDKM